MGYNLRDSLTILGVILLVAFIIAVLTIVTRRRKHRHRPQLSRSAWPAGASKSHNPQSSPPAPRNGHRRRRHRRRREHRPRNPTLADTGGLPPPRAGEPPPPAL